MATVLPFDPAFRRTPRGLRAVARRPAAPIRRRETPVPRRAARAVTAAVRAAETSSARAAERILLTRFAPLALLVACADLVTKQLAGATLADGAPHLELGPLALQLVYNTGVAGGASIGPHTRAISFMTTGIVVGLLVLMVPSLARADRRSTRAIALVAGGGLGNLVSLAASPRGVEDFLAWRHAHGAFVFNVADVAIVAGLVLLAGTVWELARLMRDLGPRGRVAAA